MVFKRRKSLVSELLFAPEVVWCDVCKLVFSKSRVIFWVFDCAVLFQVYDHRYISGLTSLHCSLFAG
jgi:hypothetical protein